MLTSFNGTAITYDEIGNPLSYYNGENYTFTWDGRRLATAVKGSNNMSFIYDDEGLRISKTVNSVTTNYYYQGSLLYAEETNSQITVYIYDENGAPIGFMYRGADYGNGVWDIYAFEKNVQGDVVAVYNASTGVKLISYKYNAWGECTAAYYNGGASTTATKNPYKYRGYYYDSDLDLYYLQTRYYDPAICRFISPDSLMSGTNGSLHGFNLYAYCFNNPVSYTDSEGNWPEWMEDAYQWFNGKKEEAEAALEDVINFVEEKVEQVTDWYNRKNEFDPSDAKENFDSNKFMYDESDYNFINADDYARYLKDNHYQDSSRTAKGLYAELQAHYLFYHFGHPSALNGADMGEIGEDKNARFFEIIGTAFFFI